MQFFSSRRIAPRFQQTIGTVLMLAMLGSTTGFAARVLLDAVGAKQALTKRGIGKLVRITESDGTDVAGVLTVIHDHSFEITPENTTVPTTIKYDQVTEIHNSRSHGPHPHNGNGVKIAVGVAVVGAVVTAIVLLLHYHGWWGG